MIKPLPPDPKIKFDKDLISLTSEADSSILQLSGALSIVPEDSPVISFLQILECLSSYSIDGYDFSFQSYFERDPETTKKINNYMQSIDLSLRLIKDVPHASHIIKSIHKKISETEVKRNKRGEYRESKSWVGAYSSSDADAEYVAPSPDEIEQLMFDLDKYISSNISYPAIINAALIHAQFEMIHPFASLNGIVGRILFHLQLLWKKKLTQPVFLISSSLNKRRNEYFDRLKDIEKNNNWEGWIKFFLRSTIDSAEKTRDTIKRYLLLEKQQHELIKEFASPAAIKLLDYFLQNPISSVSHITESIALSKQAVSLIIPKFIELGIISETSGKQRNRIYSNTILLSLFKD